MRPPASRVRTSVPWRLIPIRARLAASPTAAPEPFARYVSLAHARSYERERVDALKINSAIAARRTRPILLLLPPLIHFTPHEIPAYPPHSPFRSGVLAPEHVCPNSDSGC